MVDVTLIDAYKEVINSILKHCSELKGTIPPNDFNQIIKGIKEPTDTSDNIRNIFNELTAYENANTYDKARNIYDRLDTIAAQINITVDNSTITISQTDDTICSDEEAETEKATKYFTALGIKNENITYIESLSKFVEFTSGLNLDYLSRGQRNYKWKLLPSALRKNTTDDNSLYTEDNTKWMLDEFKRSLKHYDKTFSAKNPLEQEAYAQHYSVPTNLIDFTEAHNLALLFALEKYDSKDFSIVFFVDAQAYNTKKCHKGKEKPIPNCSDNDCNAGAAPIFMKSDNVNERIHFQKGYFLKIPDNYENDDLLADLKDFIKIVLIAHENKEKILTELFLLGVSFQDIYPDLDNLTKSIKFKNRIKQRSENND